MFITFKNKIKTPFSCSGASTFVRTFKLNDRFLQGDEGRFMSIYTNVLLIKVYNLSNAHKTFTFNESLQSSTCWLDPDLQMKLYNFTIGWRELSCLTNICHSLSYENVHSFKWSFDLHIPMKVYIFSQLCKWKFTCVQWR